MTTQARDRRAVMPAGQCAYEKYCQVLGIPADYDGLSVIERQAWFNAGVEAWKKLREANEGKVYLT